MRQADYTLPIWHYIGAVGCLFVLTLLAPFTWKNVDSSRPATWSTPERRVVAIETTTPILSRTVPIGSPPVEAVAVSEPEPSQSIEFTPAVAGTRMQRTEPSAMAVASLRPVKLSEIPAPRQQATATPTIASRMQPRVPTPVPTHAPTLAPTTDVPKTVSTVAGPVRPVIVVSSESEMPVLPPQTVAIPTTPATWPSAVSLIAQFRELQSFAETQSWATEAITTLEEIYRQDSLSTPDLIPLLDELSSVVQQGIGLAENASSPEMRIRIRHAGYATIRRELLWRQVNLITTRGVSEIPVISSQETREHLAAIRIKIGNDPNAMAWRKYLRLDDFQACLDELNADTFIALAGDVLVRMNSPQLTSSQRAILQQSPFLDLHRELRRSVVTPIDYRRLLGDMERYEATRSAQAAKRIATTIQKIRWSDNESLLKLVEILEVHYRNANLRVAVRDDLLNRMLPQQDEFEDEVNENIVGAYVYGSAWGTARMRTVLIPDQYRWRFGLEVEGEVQSQTIATRGPATFYYDGQSHFQARKLFQIDRHGVRVSDSEAVATMNSELTGFRTLFDSLPIIGWVARGIVRQQHDDQTEMARWVSETRLETRMRERLDLEVQNRLEESQAIIEKKIIAPLRRLELGPDVIEMRTTQHRLIARYRLAGNSHLGAFTPRPQAPSDTMLSVQVHESMLNNTLDKLGLAGKRTKLRQLYRELADAFDRTDLEVPDDIPENITIQFAKENPVRVYCENGKLMLALRIAELKNRHNSWRYFEVRAEYVPDSTDLHANLVRDGVIQLIGRRLRIGDQIALRTIFSRVLSKDQPFNIINSKLAENPAIADLNVNQFVIANGWIGVALGPQRIAARTVPVEPAATVVR
jgi:hypothetical protein